MRCVEEYDDNFEDEVGLEIIRVQERIFNKNITSTTLKDNIKLLNIKDRIASEIWFLFQNSQETYGFDAKYSKNKDIISDINNII